MIIVITSFISSGKSKAKPTPKFYNIEFEQLFPWPFEIDWFNNYYHILKQVLGMDKRVDYTFNSLKGFPEDYNVSYKNVSMRQLIDLYDVDSTAYLKNRYMGCQGTYSKM